MGSCELLVISRYLGCFGVRANSYGIPGAGSSLNSRMLNTWWS